MSFVRIRLTFQHTLPHTEVKNCWFLVDSCSCSTIADLEYLIKKRFVGLLKSCDLNLFLDDFLLPSQEKIEIIQNNDNIRVEMQQMTTTYTVKDKEKDSRDKKLERKRKKNSLPDSRNKPKKKQVGDDDDDDDKVSRDTKRKRDNLTKGRVQDYNETQKEIKRAKRKKHSTQGSKKLGEKESGKEKAAHKRHKPNLPSVVASNDSSLVKNEKRPTKASSSPLTSRMSSQLRKPNKPSKEKSTPEPKPSNVPKVSSKANINQRKNSSVFNGTKRSKCSSTSSDSSSDMDESDNTMLKNSRLSSVSLVSSPSHLSTSSSKNEKENSNIENSKHTSLSLLNPAPLTLIPSPTVCIRTQTGDINGTPVNQLASGSNIEQNNPIGQVQPLLRTNKSKAKKPESGHSTSHIRFDSEESEGESFKEQQPDIVLTSDTTEPPKVTPPSMSPSMKNQPKISETSLSELKESATRDYSLCMPLHGPPRSKDKIAYKVLELSASYTPEISSYKEGTVLDFDPASGAVKIELTKESLKKVRGDGHVTGKFELVYDESQENAHDEDKGTESMPKLNRVQKKPALQL